MRKRPDGSALLAAGGILLVLSLACLGVALSLASSAYYDAPTIASVLLRWAANATFAFGIALIVAGSIVRALWFLPGDETKAPPKV